GPRIQVSTDGGTAPAWRGDGDELFFTTPNADQNGRIGMLSATVKRGQNTLAVGIPRKLFDGSYYLVAPVRGYDVTPDGQRFLMVRQLEPVLQPPTELVVVQDWFAEV